MTTLNFDLRCLGLLNGKRASINQMLTLYNKWQITLKLCLFFYLVSGHLGNIIAQTPSIQWQKALGGTSDDVPQCIYQTKDGGFIIGGATGSKDGDVVGNHGGGDLWVVKFSDKGLLEWKRTLGGAGQEKGTLIQQTADKGYIVGGTTASSNGDVKGYHGGGDIWVIKLNEMGAIEWQQSLGGSASDEIIALQEVLINDISNGFIVGGNSSSGNGDVSGYHGGKDVWVIKLSPTGAKQWQRALGSSGEETLNELNPTPDGGFIVGSRTSTNGGDVSGVHGSVDLWIVKLDGAGNIAWKRTLGGSGLENFAAVKPTSDGGYIIGTSSNSNDGDVKGLSTVSGIWIVKLNATGSLSWQKKYDENGNSEYRSIRQTKDGGYIVSGSGRDNDGTTSGGTLLSKLYANGTEAWRKEFGMGKSNEPYLMQQTTDNGYILGGTTSYNGYLSGVDHWMIKLDESGNKKWEKAFGGSGEDWYWAGCCGATTLGGYVYFSSLLPYMKLQSSDGGYYFAVSTKSRDGDVTGLHYSSRLGVRSDIWVVKLGPEGQSTLQSMVAPVKNEELETLHGAKAFPNPFTKQTTIQFTAKETGKASVELYNMKGVRIRSVFNKTVIGGQTYYVPVKDIDLSKGIYFFFINNNKSRLSGRLVKN